MNKPHPVPVSSLQTQNVKRRRTLAASAATAAAAAISIAGCSMGGGTVAQPAQPLNPQQTAAERQAMAYQSDVQAALNKLDPVDRERIRAATQKPAAPSISKSPTTPVVLTSKGGSHPGAAIDPAESSDHTSDHSSGAATPSTPETPAAATPAPTAAATPDPKPAVTESLAAPAAAPNLVLSASPSPTSPTSEVPSFIPPPGATGIVIAAPLSSDTAVPVATIAPFTPPATPGASAMGSMIALAQPSQIAISDSAASAVTAASAESSFDDAMDILRKNVAEHPTLNTALAMALLDSAKGADAIKKLPESDQRLASDLLTALDAMKNKTAAPTLAERAAPILDATKGWQEDADLALPRLVLASRVDSFGVFTPAPSTFQQGQRHTVIIYCEVANFRSVKGAGGGDDSWYTTKLTQQETLYTEDGLLIWRPNPEDVEDRSMNQRHDFYLVKKLTIPETLAAGKYTLRMSVTDRATKKVKIIEMPIEIVTK